MESDDSGDLGSPALVNIPEDVGSIRLHGVWPDRGLRPQDHAVLSGRVARRHDHRLPDAQRAGVAVEEAEVRADLDGERISTYHRLEGRRMVAKLGIEPGLAKCVGGRVALVGG